MSGDLDLQYIVARSVLLDALSALSPHRQAVILVGAQAIYLHTGAIELAVAEFTTDVDLTLDPALLTPTPGIESSMTAAGFRRRNRVGAWGIDREIKGVPAVVEVDLMVPEAVGGPGSRAARLEGHAKHVARKARGLEAALIDNAEKIIQSLDPADKRSFVVKAAGPAALTVSKLHKIQERLAQGKRERIDDKDALDVLRLLRATPTEGLARAFLLLLAANVASEVTKEALAFLEELFSNARGTGAQMAERALGGLSPAGEIAASCAILATDLLAAIAEKR